jgi:hypothetical protein
MNFHDALSAIYLLFRTGMAFNTVVPDMNRVIFHEIPAKFFKDRCQ